MMSLHGPAWKAGIWIRLLIGHLYTLPEEGISVFHPVIHTVYSRIVMTFISQEGFSFSSQRRISPQFLAHVRAVCNLSTRLDQLTWCLQRGERCLSISFRFDCLVNFSPNSHIPDVTWRVWRSSCSLVEPPAAKCSEPSAAGHASSQRGHGDLGLPSFFFIMTLSVILGRLYVIRTWGTIFKEV